MKNKRMKERKRNYINSFNNNNSYAWDTAIVYIQAMGNTNYANANRDTTGNTSLLNTGTTGDQKCKIYDLAANCFEVTTEFCSNTHPCTGVGGCFFRSDLKISIRGYLSADARQDNCTFRPLLYVR